MNLMMEVDEEEYGKKRRCQKWLSFTMVARQRPQTNIRSCPTGSPQLIIAYSTPYSVVPSGYSISNPQGEPSFFVTHTYLHSEGPFSQNECARRSSHSSSLETRNRKGCHCHAVE